MSDRIEIHAAELQALEDELRRFREREPAVQALIAQINPDVPAVDDDWASGVKVRARETRDFPATLGQMMSLAGTLEECEALKLRLFEEREPLVRELLAAIDEATENDDAACNERLDAPDKAVRDFKVTP